MNGRTRAIAAIPGGDVLDIAPDGAALLSVGASSGELRLSTSDSDRQISSLPYAFGEVSADGRTVVYGANGGIFLQAVAGGAPVHLTDGMSSHLSPDGRTVLVYRGVQGQRSLAPVGPGEEKPVRFAGIADHDIGAVQFTDSKHILFSVAPNRRPEALFLGDLETLAARRLPVAGEVPFNAFLSPDGTRFYGDLSGNHWYVYTRDGKPHPIAGIGATEFLHGWTPDSQGFWLYSDRDRAIYRLNPNDGKRTRWHQINSPLGSLYNLRVTPDGRNVLYNTYSSLSTLYTVKGWR
jgi:hypothetical protein